MTRDEAEEYLDQVAEDLELESYLFAEEIESDEDESDDEKDDSGDEDSDPNEGDDQDDVNEHGGEPEDRAR